MTESAAAAVRDGAGFEQPARLAMPRKTAKVLGRGRTGRDNTGISASGNLSCGGPIQTSVSSTRIAMIAPLLASLLLVVPNPALDSATVTRLLSQLKTSDSVVCAL